MQPRYCVGTSRFGGATEPRVEVIVDQAKASESGAVDHQGEVIAFLSRPDSYHPCSAEVQRIETHGAYVFLAGDRAIKVKRAVRYAYMDFSTVERRHRALLRELELNQPAAPEIYREVVAITRAGDGALRFGGDGPVVEWALVMRRFGQGQLLSHHAAAEGVPPTVAKALADAIIEVHQLAPPASQIDGVAYLASVIGELAEAFGDGNDVLGPKPAFAQLATAQLERVGPVLRRRAQHGHVRRCHGDLHLNNVVLWNGRPTLFDALEFDEQMATIDTLYDLAFMLMDLDVFGARGAANVVLNRYLWRSGAELDLEGLAALPLFLGMRAAVRAMVALQKARLGEVAVRADADRQARRYYDVCLRYLQPPSPRLVAIGGYSGTGKSTLAAGLAPLLGPVPGAVHLRSDLERKAMFGVRETERLPETAYSEEANANVYAALYQKAATVLEAGHAVVVDAVFSKSVERNGIEAVARRHEVGCDGVWLSAAQTDLIRRVGARTGDASDATGDVVLAQIERGSGTVKWPTVDAGADPETTLARTRQAIGI